MAQLLNETMVVKGKITESDTSKLPKGVLCRGVWPIANIGKLNQNNRIYEKSVFEKSILNNEGIQDKMKSRVLFGHAEHPSATQSDLQLTSHVITGTFIKEDNGDEIVYQNIDVLDTPCGRIVNTLLEADCAVGVSTRAEGDLEEKTGDDGKKFMRVIPESYRYVTTDFTADPSTYGTKPLNVVREIKSELSSGKLTNEEKVFATTLLEAIEKTENKKKESKESIIPDYEKDSEETQIKKLTEASVIDRWKAFMKERWPEKPEDDSYAKEWLDRFKKGEEWNRSDYEGRRVLKKLYPDKYPDNKDAIMKNAFESKTPEYREGTMEEFVKKELVKVGILAECLGAKGKVTEIKEHTVSITFDNGASATVTGTTPVSVGEDGTVLIPNIAPAPLPVEPIGEPAPCDTCPEGGLSDDLTPAEEEQAIEKEEDLKDALADDVITPEEHEEMETPEEEAAEHAPGGYEEGEEPGGEPGGGLIPDETPEEEAGEEIPEEAEDELPEEPEEEDEEELEESKKVNEVVDYYSTKEWLNWMDKLADSPNDTKGFDVKRVSLDALDEWMDKLDGYMDDLDEEGKDRKEYIAHKRIYDMLNREYEHKRDNVRESKTVDETKNINKLYTKKGLTPPKGKGIHKKKFHEMATAIAAGQKKEGKSEKDAKKSGYAIAMSKLGKKGAVKAGHRRDESKSVNEDKNWLDEYNISDPMEKRILCVAINNYGGGGHPVAEPDNLRIFTAPYAKYALDKMMRSGNITEKGMKLAKDVMSLLGAVEMYSDEEEELEESKKVNEKGNPYAVYLNGKLIDTVFDDETDVNEVKRSLVNHDGYDPNIVVKPTSAKKEFESKLVFESYDDMVDYLKKEFGNFSTEQVTKLSTVFPANTLNERKGTNTPDRNLAVKEAASRAEAEKAMELLAEADAKIQSMQESIRIESKVLADKLKEAKTQESKEVVSLRTLLESTIKKARELDKALTETKAKLEDSKKLYESKVKEIEKASQSKLIKEYVNMKSHNSALTLPSNSRALLEGCATIKEVDKVFEDVRDALRREALLPSSGEISVQITEKVDAVQDRISESIGDIMNVM